MDTSETYIKMCDKAEEIQKAWKPRFADWFLGPYTARFEADIATMPISVCGCEDGWYATVPLGCDTEDYSGTPDERCVWLPRQDQLQEMVLPTIRERYDNKVIMGHTLDDVNRVANWLVDIFLLKIGEHGLKSNSMEQLWLAFVMSEKYGKRWTGEEWA